MNVACARSSADRVADFESDGRWFESTRARFSNLSCCISLHLTAVTDFHRKRGLCV